VNRLVLTLNRAGNSGRMPERCQKLYSASRDSLRNLSAIPWKTIPSSEPASHYSIFVPLGKSLYIRVNHVNRKHAPFIFHPAGNHRKVRVGDTVRLLSFSEHHTDGSQWPSVAPDLSKKPILFVVEGLAQIGIRLKSPVSKPSCSLKFGSWSCGS